MQDSLMSEISIEKTYPKARSFRMEKTKYVLLFLVLSLIAGCIPLLSLKINLPLGWLKLIQILVVGGLGLIHVKKINQYNVQPNDEVIGLKHPLLVSSLILIALAILYYFVAPVILVMALGSASAFLLPHIINHSWITFSAVSQTDYGIWNTPLPDTREKTFIFFGGLPVKIKFSIDADDGNKKLFRSYAPPDKSLGEFFNHLLLIQRNNNKLDIELLDERQQPFGWKFYRTDYMGLIKRQINPDESFEEMDLKKTEIILAKRVRLESGDKANL